MTTYFFESFIVCKTKFAYTILPSSNSKFKLSKTSEKQIVSISAVSSESFKKQNFLPFLVFLSFFSDMRAIILLDKLFLFEMFSTKFNISI